MKFKEDHMENKLQISLTVNQEFDSLYKLGYFLIDINSILTFGNKINKQTIEEAEKHKKYHLGITSRYFNKDSLDNIKIEKFQQGSLLLQLIGELIIGVLLLIIAKYINQNENKEKINVTINNIQITNIIEKYFDKRKSLDENFETIIKELNKEGIIMENGLLYDKDGKKILIKNMERIKGQIINQKW
jgi:hypothetical protein